MLKIFRIRLAPQLKLNHQVAAPVSTPKVIKSEAHSLWFFVPTLKEAKSAIKVKSVRGFAIVRKNADIKFLNIVVLPLSTFVFCMG